MLISAVVPVRLSMSPNNSLRGEESYRYHRISHPKAFDNQTLRHLLLHFYQIQMDHHGWRYNNMQILTVLL